MNKEVILYDNSSLYSSEQMDSMRQILFDECAAEYELFDSYKKAYDRFLEIIANEKKFEMSWASGAFNENGELQKDYQLDEHIETDGTDEYDCWWNLTCKNDWYLHDYIDLRVMEVK